MSRIKPVHIMFEPGIGEHIMLAVQVAVAQILRWANVGQRVEVRNFSVWRQDPFHDGNGKLLPYQSVDWYLAQGYNSKHPHQLRADKVLNCFIIEPWQKQNPHYDLLVTLNDLWSGDDGNNFIVGLAQSELGSIVSMRRFIPLGRDSCVECVQTEIFHEMGHVFGLPSDIRQKGTEDCLGRHCTNQCVMRQGLTVPQDWLRMTRDRLNNGVAYCDDCLRELREFFCE